VSLAGQVVERIKGDTAELASVVTRSPLPGGVASAVRFLFNLPPWVQIAGLIGGIIVAGIVLVLLWRRRRAIVRFVSTRSRATLIGLAAVAVVIASGGVIAADASWNYTQHNNNFCVACHVMTDAYSRFQTSAHHTLQCHDCHQQSIAASMMQVYYWVAERPQSIPPHAKVPTEVCAQCHLQGAARATWQRVIATAGHSVHLRSADARLKNLQCVSCHGTELHRFLPVESTCGQSGCHAGVTVRLGGMRNQTALHCVTCHPFTAPVAEHVSPDSAARVLAPTTQQCLDCHEMRRVMATYDPTHDKHGGQCGWCHDPHKQATPQAAFTTCMNAGCHAKADTLTPLHRGLPNGMLARCGDCHSAHTWSVSGTACIRCHSDIFRAAHAARPPIRTASGRTDTTAVGAWWRPITWLARHVVPRGAPSLSLAAPWPVEGPTETRPVTADTLPRFDHKIHRAVPCASCHNSEQLHGALTLHSVTDCLACHHTSSPAMNCGHCHQPAELAGRDSVSTPIPMAARATLVSRPLPFAHGQHTSIGCQNCHVQAVTLAPRSCANCHADHHRASLDCEACHAPALSAHNRDAHLGCSGSGCHNDAAVLALAPTDNVCMACHQHLGDRHPHGTRECTACHGLAWSPVAMASP